MRRLLTLMLAAAVLAAGSANALELNGSVGGGYGRNDAWSPTAHAGVNQFDWEASLNASGDIFRPGILQWLLGGDYHGARSLYFDSSSALDGLAYRGQLALLSASPVPLTFKIGRSWTQFSDSEKAGMGSTLVTTEGGTAALRFAQMPTLRLALNRTDVENHAFGAGVSRSDTTGLQVGVAQSLTAFQYQLTYDTSWNGGTYDETNYQSHAVNADVSSALSDQVRFHFLDRYYLRDPTRDVATNPRYDDNAISTGVQWRPNIQTTVSFDYGFRHLQVATAGNPDSELQEHTLSNSTYRKFTPELTFLGNVNVSYTIERLGTRQLDTGSQTAGAGLTWKRDVLSWLSLDLSGGGAAGVTEQSAKSPAFAWGVNWNAGSTARWTRVRLGLFYSGEFHNAASVGGEAINHRVVAQGEGYAGSAYLNGRAHLEQTQRLDPLMGLYEARSAMASFGANFTRFSTRLSGGLTEGLSDPLRAPDIHSGLVLPASFNTKSRYANLTVNIGADRNRLVFTGIARTMAVDAPGRPEQYEHGVGLTATYTIGAFQFSLEDQLSVGGTGQTWQRGNRVMLRVIRNLGFNF